MASWSTTTRHEPSEINGGQRYEIGDQLSLEHLNAITENALYNTSVIVDKTEVVYDMASSSSSKNWGYTSGIQDGTTISGKNFSKYKKLRIYWMPFTDTYYGHNSIFDVDLTHLYSTEYFANFTARKYINNTDQITTKISINTAKTSISVDIRYNGNTLNDGYVYMIEGVY